MQALLREDRQRMKECIKLNYQFSLQMKQNELTSAMNFSKVYHTSRPIRQTNENQRRVYSPRLITRKKQIKNIPTNAFARRKSSQQQNAVYRYLSPKSRRNEEQCTFLSDDNGTDSIQQKSDRSMFDLDFSRINVEKSQGNIGESYCAQNLFEDMNCSHNIEADNSIVSLNLDLRRKDWGKVEDQTGLSLETMSQSPHQKYSRRIDERISNFIRQNSRLITEKMRLTKENQTLREQIEDKDRKNQQLSNEINTLNYRLNQQQNQVQSRYKGQLKKSDEKILELSSSLQYSEGLVAQLQNRNNQLQNQNRQFLQRLGSCQKQLHQRQKLINQLNTIIQQYKLQINEKYQYGKCLEDVILQLNEKIDGLKKQNQDISCLLDQRQDQLQLIEMDLQQTINTARQYEAEIQQCHRRISSLTEEKYMTFKNNPQSECKCSLITNYTNSPSQSSLISHLRQQVHSLHNLLNLERQHNQQLKKQLSYKHLELSLHKKTQYDEQKLKKEIQSLKQRNKKLMKKVNQLMEQNTEVKEQLERQKKHNKNLNLNKKSNSKEYIEDSSEVKVSPFSRTNVHQSQLLCKGPNMDQKRPFKFDSDDQLSFKLSPEKK